MKQALGVLAAFAFAGLMILLTYLEILSLWAAMGIAAVVWVAILVFAPKKSEHR
ncbi:hypothetical protein [Streptomyces sp. DG1A-41]|uniref:hypothetical protein n=1 Tax=Streptomyces sp. DG1A-41 TaxID=3125779 RepID=UPI0030CE1A46